MLQLNLTRNWSATPSPPLSRLARSSANPNSGCGLDLIDSLATSIEARLDQLLLMLNNNGSAGLKGKRHRDYRSSEEETDDDELAAWKPGSCTAPDAETLRRYVNSLRWCPTGGHGSNGKGKNNRNGNGSNGCCNELTLRHLRQHFRPDVTRAYLALKAADLAGDFCEPEFENESRRDTGTKEMAWTLHFHGADSWRDLVAVVAALSESERPLRLAIVCFCEEAALLPHLEFLREALLTTGITRGCRVETMRLSPRLVTAEDLRLAAIFQGRELGQRPPALAGFLSQRSALQAPRTVWIELQRLHRRLYVVTAGAPPSALLGQSLHRCGFTERSGGCGLQSWRFVQQKRLQLKTDSMSREQASPREKLTVLMASVVLLTLSAQLFTRPLCLMTLLRTTVCSVGIGCLLAAVYLLHLALTSAFSCVESNLDRCVRQGQLEWRRCLKRVEPLSRVIGRLVSMAAAGAALLARHGSQSQQLRRR